MQSRFLTGLAVVAAGVIALAGCSKETVEKPAAVQTKTDAAPSADSQADAKAGEALFNQYCASCHPGGGNIINPKMTLREKDLEANGIKTAQDFIGKMRNPGPGMPKFDQGSISDKDAAAIARYAEETFK